MDLALDLQLEELDQFEAPLTDMEWGLLAGGSLAAGVAVGLIVVLT